MSRFQSVPDISSSDSESSSDENEHDVIASPASANGTKTPPVLTGTQKGKHKSSHPSHEVSDSKGLPDVDTGSHANMMTAALLEFYCLSRAADILNAQEGSHRGFTRESPEVQFLGKKMYNYKSNFLSSHGVLAGDVDKEELGTTRQYYRDNLDLLGASALEGHIEQPPVSMTKDLTLASRPSRNAHRLADTTYAGLTEARDPRAEMLGIKQFSSGRNSSPLENIRLDISKLPSQSFPFSGSSPVSFPLFSSQPSPPMNSHSLSRYATEFSEVGVLGRGSYGEVYHVQNHIDGQNYAVKKIPLSQKRLEQLQFGPHNQLETIMKEIRTLARLEHTNVVRYYGAWVEQVHSSGHGPPRQPAPFELDHEQTQSTNLLSHASSVDNQSYGIVFEHSESSVAETHSGSASMGYGVFRSDVSQRNSHSTTVSHRSRSSGNNVEIDEEIESITRDFSASQGQLSTFGGTDGDIFTDGLSHDASKMQVQRRHQDGAGIPAVVLHIQMSLHPTSLSSYLNPQPDDKRRSDQSVSRRHCYHLMPSLRLMLSIISGVEYIHSKGIVHRDLKPANIFLSSPENSNLKTCYACQKQVESAWQYCHPRIGDFGLVADISHLNESSSKESSQSGLEANHVVGTEFYRPPMSSSEIRLSELPDEFASDQAFNTVDEKLDIYSLGVVLFELLYRLGTKMERQLVLSDLTRGTNSPSSAGSNTERTVFPSDFAKKVDMGQMILDDGMCVAESLMMCIKGMLEPRPQHRWRCSSVKEHLRRILAASEKASRA